MCLWHKPGRRIWFYNRSSVIQLLWLSHSLSKPSAVRPFAHVVATVANRDLRVGGEEVTLTQLSLL